MGHLKIMVNHTQVATVEFPEHYSEQQIRRIVLDHPDVQKRLVGQKISDVVVRDGRVEIWLEQRRTAHVTLMGLKVLHASMNVDIPIRADNEEALAAARANQHIAWLIDQAERDGYEIERQQIVRRGDSVQKMVLFFKKDDSHGTFVLPNWQP